MEIPEAEISKRVRVLLAEHGITASELARRLGLNQSYIARRMRGTVPWRAADLALVAGELRVPTSLLIERGESPASAA